MDLMTLAAKLTLDDGDFRRGVGDAEASGRSLANKLSSMSVAVGQIVADMAKKAISEINGLIRGTIGGFADYQQLIGGVETLFKTSSDKVVGYAKQAFRTAGVSANEYMEMVTSFSASLLQGLGGDTEAAAELANMALIDMADNAAKMGTDISAIQAAYQGFARQNFTMLDNLKLGYGGTASEMIRLVNDSHILDHEIESLDEITFAQLIEAIHAIQEEMGLTGTQAKEAADTISGSKGSLVAAWKDLLAAVGGAGDETDLNTALENFKTNFGTYMENLIPTILESIGNSGTLVNAIADSIASLPTDLLTQVSANALDAGTDMLSGAQKIVNWLIDSLTSVFSTASIDSSHIADFGEAIGKFIGGTVSNIIKNLPAITEGLIATGISLAGNIVKGLWEGLFGSESGNEIEEIQRDIEKKISATEISSSRAEAILGYMSELAAQYGEAVKETDEWKKAQDELEEVLGGSSEVFEQYGSDIQGAINKLREMSEELRRLAIQQAMQEKVESLYGLLGEYTMQRFNAQEEIEYARREQGDLDKKRAETAMAYARVLMENGALEEGSSAWYTAKNTLETPGYAGTGLNELTEAIEYLYEVLGTREEDRIWNQDEYDYVVSPETIASLNTEYDLQRQTIENAEKTIKEADEAIENVTRQIEIAENAAARAAKELGVALGTSGKQMVDAATYFSSQIRSMGSSVATSDRVSPAFERSGYSYMPRAVGIEYSPAGLRTELHQGEAILTREENAARLQGYNYGEMEQMLEDAIERSMARMQISMDGQRVADLTTRRMASNISGADHARVRAMGG